MNMNINLICRENKQSKFDCITVLSLIFLVNDLIIDKIKQMQKE